MVKPRDECPACATGTLRLSRVVGQTSEWTCTACHLAFHESEASRREPNSDGNQDFVADSIFGGRVRAARVVKGTTQMQVAALVDCDWSVIAAIENGELSPRLRTLLRLARAVGVDPARLISGLPGTGPDRFVLDVRDKGG